MSQKQNRPFLPAILVLVALCGLLELVQAPWAQDVIGPQKGGSKPKSPTIAWTPDQLSLDGNDTVSVTLTAQSAIPATSLEFVPELSPYLSVSPQVLPPLAKGAIQVIQIAASVPAGTPMDTTKGTLHVRAGNSTSARPLPIVLSLWPKILNEGGDFSVAAPPGFTSQSFSDADPQSGTMTHEIEVFSVSEGMCETIIQIVVRELHTPATLSDLATDISVDALLSQDLVYVTGRYFLKSILVTPAGQQTLYQLIQNGILAEITVHDCPDGSPYSIEHLLSSLEIGSMQ